MDESTRKGLNTLQGLLDEKFITQAEFHQRRKVLLDAATGMQGSTSVDTASARRIMSAAVHGGDDADMTTGVTADGEKWGHDGYMSLYSKGNVFSRIGSAGSSKGVAKGSVFGRLSGGIVKPGGGAKGGGGGKKAVAAGQRVVTIKPTIVKPSKATDLRSLLGNKPGVQVVKASGGGRPRSGGNKKMPEKCPW